MDPKQAAALKALVKSLEIGLSEPIEKRYWCMVCKEFVLLDEYEVTAQCADCGSVSVQEKKPKKKRKMKLPIDNQMPKFVYKGQALHPLTEEEARSLDERDVLKFIGKATSQAYRSLGRSLVSLPERPKFDPATRKLTIKVAGYYGDGSNISSFYTNFALVKRGDKDGVRARAAKRYISMNLRGFKRDVEALAKRTIERIDGHLEGLPLHKKMELFKDIPEKEKLIYDFVYRDFEKVLGQEEGPADGAETENQ